MRLIMTTDDFIAKSKRVYGEGLYDYSKVQYVNHRAPIILGCKHGHWFKAIPTLHLSGNIHKYKTCSECHPPKVKSVRTKEQIMDYAKALGMDYHYHSLDPRFRGNISYECKDHGGGIYSQTTEQFLAGRLACKLCRITAPHERERWLKRHEDKPGNLLLVHLSSLSALPPKHALRLEYTHQPPIDRLNQLRSLYDYHFTILHVFSEVDKEDAWDILREVRLKFYDPRDPEGLTYFNHNWPSNFPLATQHEVEILTLLRSKAAELEGLK